MTSLFGHRRDEKDRRQATMSILSPMRAMARRVFRDGDAEGQSMVEYSLIMILMIVVCLTVLSTMADTINEKLFQVVGAMP
jgi:Flp pilus assembly pilin Flp